jgi:hypothetical protein
MRRIVITKHGQITHHVDALGVRRYQHHRLLLVTIRFRIGLAHDDEQLAARIVRAARPPLATVDDVVATFAANAAFDVGGIGRRDRRLRHQERRTDVTGQQRLQPFILVSFGAVAFDGFHVAGIGRGTIEDFRRPGHAAHDFAERRVFQVRQPFRRAR